MIFLVSHNFVITFLSNFFVLLYFVHCTCVLRTFDFIVLVYFLVFSFLKTCFLFDFLFLFSNLSFNCYFLFDVFCSL